jgi:hypothetical protein
LSNKGKFRRFRFGVCIRLVLFLAAVFIFVPLQAQTRTQTETKPPEKKEQKKPRQKRPAEVRPPQKREQARPRDRRPAETRPQEKREQARPREKRPAETRPPEKREPVRPREKKPAKTRPPEKREQAETRPPEKKEQAKPPDRKEAETGPPEKKPAGVQAPDGAHVEEIIKISKLKKEIQKFTIKRNIFSPDIMKPNVPAQRFPTTEMMRTQKEAETKVEQEKKSVLQAEIENNFSYEGYVLKDSGNIALVSLNAEFYAVGEGDIVAEKVTIIIIEKETITVEFDNNIFEIQLKGDEPK